MPFTPDCTAATPARHLLWRSATVAAPLQFVERAYALPRVGACADPDHRACTVVTHQSSNDSSCMRERSRSTAFVCICETRDSVTPSTSPISRRVRFS
jgi:hypothetical protein